MLHLLICQCPANKTNTQIHLEEAWDSTLWLCQGLSAVASPVASIWALHSQMWAGALNKRQANHIFLCCLFTMERNFHWITPKVMLKRTRWNAGMPRQRLLEWPVRRIPPRSNPSLGNALSNTFQVNKRKSLVKIKKKENWPISGFYHSSCFFPSSFLQKCQRKT